MFLSSVAQFQTAQVSFTHFTTLVEATWTSAETLQRLYMRAAALVLNPGAEGSDLVIPVRFPPSGAKRRGPATYGAILIQVKNYDATTSMPRLEELATRTLAPVIGSTLPVGRVASVVYVLGSKPFKSREGAHHDFFVLKYV